MVFMSEAFTKRINFGKVPKGIGIAMLLFLWSLTGLKAQVIDPGITTDFFTTLHSTGRYLVVPESTGNSVLVVDSVDFSKKRYEFPGGIRVASNTIDSSVIIMRVEVNITGIRFWRIRDDGKVYPIVNTPNIPGIPFWTILSLPEGDRDRAYAYTRNGQMAVFRFESDSMIELLGIAQFPSSNLFMSTFNGKDTLLASSNFGGSRHQLWSVANDSFIRLYLFESPDYISGPNLNESVLIGHFRYFLILDKNLKNELWKTDGTVSGTQKVMTLSNMGTYVQMGEASNRLLLHDEGELFYMDDQENIIPAGVDENLGPTAYSEFASFTTRGRYPLVPVSTDLAGMEMGYFRDSVIYSMGDLFPGKVSGAYFYGQSSLYGENIYLMLTSPGFGRELHEFNTTTNTLRSLPEIVPGAGGADINEMYLWGDLLMFGMRADSAFVSRVKWKAVRRSESAAADPPVYDPQTWHRQNGAKNRKTEPAMLGHDLLCDQDGNTYVLMGNRGGEFAFSDTAFFNSGINTTALFSYDSLGNLRWLTRLGRSTLTSVLRTRAMCRISDHEILVGTYTQPGDYLGTDLITPAISGFYLVWIDTKTGAVKRKKYIDATGEVLIQAIDRDEKGDLFICLSHNTTLTIAGKTYYSGGSSFPEAPVLHLDSDGNLLNQWPVSLGTSFLPPSCHGLVASGGRVYLTLSWTDIGSVQTCTPDFAAARLDCYTGEGEKVYSIPFQSSAMMGITSLVMNNKGQLWASLFFSGSLFSGEKFLGTTSCPDRAGILLKLEAASGTLISSEVFENFYPSDMYLDEEDRLFMAGYGDEFEFTSAAEGFDETVTAFQVRRIDPDGVVYESRIWRFSDFLIHGLDTRHAYISGWQGANLVLGTEMASQYLDSFLNSIQSNTAISVWRVKPGEWEQIGEQSTGGKTGYEVFPNPAGDEFRVRNLSGFYPFKSIRMYTASGALVKSFVLERTEMQTFYLGDLSPGLYFLRFEGGSATESHLLLIH